MSKKKQNKEQDDHQLEQRNIRISKKKKKLGKMAFQHIAFFFLYTKQHIACWNQMRQKLSNSYKNEAYWISQLKSTKNKEDTYFFFFFNRSSSSCTIMSRNHSLTPRSKTQNRSSKQFQLLARNKAIHFLPGTLLLLLQKTCKDYIFCFHSVLICCENRGIKLQIQ